MSESAEVLAEIRKRLKGKTLLIGRKIGQDKFDLFGANLRVEAKPTKYPVGRNAIAWKSGLLRNFSGGEFDSVIFHRFVYKPVKEYVEDPLELLTEAKRVLSERGVLVVNSFLLNDTTKNFRSAESFYTEREFMAILENQQFNSIVHVRNGGTSLFVCEK